MPSTPTAAYERPRVRQWGNDVQFVTVALLVLRLTGSGLGV